MTRADGSQQEPVSKRARGADQEILQGVYAPFPDNGSQEQRGGSIVAVPDSQQVLGGNQQMPEHHCREAESEEQKSLPFNFIAPRLQLSQDKSKVRIVWQSRGQIIADHKEQTQGANGKEHWKGQQDIIGLIIDGSYRCSTKAANAIGRSCKGHLLVRHV